jgi:uncharacterized short protein YbdD (DUF466 family)
MSKHLRKILLRCWRALRELSGDDAYERYLTHHATCHAERSPLSRKSYFELQQQHKWDGVKRCC